MKVKYFTLFHLCFIGMTAIILLNLNGFIFLTLGIKAPLSPLLLVFSVAIIYYCIFISKVKPTSNLLLLAVFFYLSYLSVGFLSYLYHPQYLHPKTSLFQLLRVYVPSVLILSSSYYAVKTYYLSNKSDLLFNILFITIFLSAFLIAIGPKIGLLNIYDYAGKNLSSGSRASGLFSNPNEAGSFGLYFLVLVLFFHSKSSKYFLFFLGLLPLALYVTFASFSRASMILSVIILFVYVTYHLKFLNLLSKSNFFKVLIFSTFLVIGSIFITNKFFNYVGELSYSQRSRLLQTFQLLQGQVNETTTSHRSELFASAWSKIQEKPFTGYGLGSFHRIKIPNSEESYGVHNTQLMIFGESGIIPIFAFCVLFIILGIRGLKHPYPSAGFFIIGICIIYFLNVAGTGHNALDHRTSNMLIGVAIALSELR